MVSGLTAADKIPTDDISLVLVFGVLELKGAFFAFGFWAMVFSPHSLFPCSMLSNDLIDEF